MEKLRTSQRKKNVIKNGCNYNILESQEYVDDFFYTKIEKRESHSELCNSEHIAKLILAGE